MADARTMTGSRDDLIVDASRCLKMRFSESSCRRCVDICPHKAVSLNGLLAVNPNHCSGCLLCTAVCPAGALEQSSDFSNSLLLLARVSEPVLGCFRTRERSNATLACLGGLSEEHLLTLCHSLTGTLTLNLTACSDCPNSTMAHHLRQRIEVLSEAGLLEGGCNIITAESAQDINYRDESVDRRSFFRSFRTSLFQSAVIMSTSGERNERHTPYGEKRKPKRLELVNIIKERSSRDRHKIIQDHFDCQISCAETCDACQGCVAICPTGALQTENPDYQPVFDNSLCTGCGLCVEFCLENALVVTPQNHLRQHTRNEVPEPL